MIAKVEKGVLIPSRGLGGRPPIKYPFREMEVGDSFFTEKKAVRVSLSSASRQLNIKFVSREVTEDGVKGVRVWRTE